MESLVKPVIKRHWDGAWLQEFTIDQFAENAVGAGSLTLSMPAASGQNGYTPQLSKSIDLYHLISC